MARRSRPVASLVAAAIVLAASVEQVRAREPDVFGQLPVPRGTYQVRLEKSTFVPMRDGVRLSTDIYFPVGAEGRFPVVMIRTPYDKKPMRKMPDNRERDYPPTAKYRWYPHFFASRGYVVVIQDHRGRLESEGEYFAWDKRDAEDGYDAIEWIIKQPWSNGKVGTIGCSYLGETQHKLASVRHPAHVAAVAQAGSSHYGAGGVWNLGFTRYGATDLAASLSWSHYMRNTFSYGPPAWVDREEWYKSELADEFSPGPFGQEPPAEKLQAALSTLPVIDALKALAPNRSEFENWVRYAHEFDNPYWKRTGMISDDMRFNVPTIHINSWYDLTPNSTIELFRLFRENAESARARDNQYLIMSAGSHCDFEQASENTLVGDRPVGDARLNYPGLYLAWFDHWVKGVENGIHRKMPKVTSYVLGANTWRTYDRWPLPAAKDQRWYLASGGKANSRAGDGTLGLKAASAESADRYVYDPRFPTPAVGGGICCAGAAMKEGGADQREIELRDDVLVFTSEPLKKGIEVAGRLTARLYVSSDAPDTDFVAKLVDVYPDGTAYIVQEGIMRARFRESLTRPAFMKPGEIYPLSIDMEATHSYFAPGHRIRLDISSSNFPRWDRNLNTGGRNYDEKEPRIARNAVHYGPAHPSHLSLLVVR